MVGAKYVSRPVQLTALQARRAAGHLRAEPAARIGADARQLVRPSSQAEAVRGNRGG
jgi:hypothetical protein